MVQGFLLEFPKNKFVFLNIRNMASECGDWKGVNIFLLYFNRLSNSSGDKKVNESVLGKDAINLD